ncbi:hypothetical protein pipiens_001742 [Culex pipiens pipiens]|uniref:Uncharacterized protein n=1 Tax=Culex pipiens pipiens TaxID=38569 RepID=A0ABD1DWD5_CULPP
MRVGTDFTRTTDRSRLTNETDRIDRTSSARRKRENPELENWKRLREFQQLDVPTIACTHKGEKIIECSELNSISRRTAPRGTIRSTKVRTAYFVQEYLLIQSSGNCVGVGTHSHVWDCGSPRYTRALPADTHWTRAEHLAVRPRSSTRRKLSSLTAAYGRRSQFTCPPTWWSHAVNQPSTT